MRFAIRDDDTNYFTKPQDLIENYSKVWDLCPVSLSVVPFHGCTKSRAIPLKYWSGQRNFPIGENTELVEFLRSKIKENKISIMLHGYSHKDNPDGYEFVTGNNLFNKVKEGKRYLENLFDIEIRTFVPPHNALSKQGLKAVVENGLNIVGNLSFRKRPLEIRTIVNYAKKKYFQVKWENIYPHALDFGDYKEIGAHSLVPLVTLEKLKSEFDFAYKIEGDFILATHYWEFYAMQEYEPMTMGEVFHQFFDYVRQFDGVRFCKVDDLFIRDGG